MYYWFSISYSRFGCHTLNLLQFITSFLNFIYFHPIGYLSKGCWIDILHFHWLLTYWETASFGQCLLGHTPFISFFIILYVVRCWNNCQSSHWLYADQSFAPSLQWVGFNGENWLICFVLHFHPHLVQNPTWIWKPLIKWVKLITYAWSKSTATSSVTRPC